MTVKESQIRATSKYNLANYDRVELRLPKGKKEKIKEHAESKGESINAFVNRAIDMAIAKDNKHG